MNQDYYDSAQLWLNKIHEIVSYRKPSVFSYYLTSRQAEVYYYNNLEQLGLQEAKRALSIATILNDDYLEADACNFCGLFLVNRGETSQAIYYFKRGISLTPVNTTGGKTIDLTSPHHLYGNLSEAYFKLGNTERALFYAEKSLIAAREIGNGRGMANALLNKGMYTLNQGTTDSSFSYLEMARQETENSEDFDVELNAYGLLAKCFLLKNDREGALQLLDSGFQLMEEHKHLNSFYALFFLDYASKVYTGYGAYRQLAATLAKRSEIQEATRLRNNEQYETIMMTGLKNETRILHMAVNEAAYEKSLATTRLYLLVLIFVLLVSGFIAYRYYSRQKLKLALVRNKISQDLHDEIGSTLSGIALYSYITREQSNKQQTEEVEKSLSIIEKNATDMVKKLNDIVWVVNPDYDSFESLLLRLEEYAVETAAAKQIAITTVRRNGSEKAKLSMDERKNTYLICKEAVNNAIKYSAASSISILATVESSQLIIRVEDNGKGFDTSDETLKGNGIINMAARAKEMNAGFTIDSQEGGTNIELRVKITR